MHLQTETYGDYVHGLKGASFETMVVLNGRADCRRVDTADFLSGIGIFRHIALRMNSVTAPWMNLLLTTYAGILLV
jgi:hypothetical protein